MDLPIFNDSKNIVKQQQNYSSNLVYFTFYPRRFPLQLFPKQSGQNKFFTIWIWFQHRYIDCFVVDHGEEFHAGNNNNELGDEVVNIQNTVSDSVFFSVKEKIKTQRNSFKIKSGDAIMKPNSSLEDRVNTLG